MNTQLIGVVVEKSAMQIEHDPSGIVILWADGRLTMLFDTREAWITWDGMLVRQLAVGSA